MSSEFSDRITETLSSEIEDTKDKIGTRREHE